MELTPERKKEIDSMSYESLLSAWRFAPAGDLRFQGETGKYWGKRMAEVRENDRGEAVAASKRIGWER